MNIELPQTRPYDGLFVLGSRLDDGGGAEEIGAIIVKAGYLLTPSGGADTHLMEPDPDPAASALVVADEDIQGTHCSGVTREADLAPYKPLPDIVVECFLTGLDATGAEVRVDGITWLTRTEPKPPLNALDLSERSCNLFGYQPRSLPPRDGEAGNPLAEPVRDRVHRVGHDPGDRGDGVGEPADR